MIYAYLGGGLGNMLFQIAALINISKNNNTNYFVVGLENQLSYLNNETNFNPKLKHSFEYTNLNMFKNLNIIKELPSDIKTIIYPFHYEDIIIGNSDVLLSGFFQSEKYFKDEEIFIKDFFKPTVEIINQIQKKYNNLFSFKTTAIHVRRGDYTKLPSHHPVQSLQYYQESLNLTKEITEKYIIFSDDIDWCKNVFKGEDFIFIENEKDYIELYLMSMCDNNIISNSSFSWWGAWLNKNPNKKIIGPKIWFGPAINHYTGDIIPENWIKI